MRIRLALELRIERRQPAPPEHEPQHEHRDTEAMTENAGAPRYVGFSAAPFDPEERAR